ncbi:sugar phosphate isomerase/epimerase family protein [Polymorphobacter sp.]|uniref:sugar phosphate isomerase/epimerase family protein n=1 Tax=Polymorphobacter sp. TaxID=1909290 RepID=UPI003F700687
MFSNPIGLASGVLVDFDAETAVRAAAEAGFRSVGLWIEPDRWTAATVQGVRSALADTGLTAIDAEVIRMKPGATPDAHRRMIEIAAELGARNILVVGTEGEAGALAESFARLCEIGEAHGVSIALEFMLFSAVPTLDAARAIVAATASPAASLLIDPLHLDRAGHSPAEVAGLPPAWLRYAQFCDAPRASIARDDHVALLREARDDRLMPGDGVLPLAALLAALPQAIPLSVELRSRALREAFPDPVDRARAVFRATSDFLARTEGP